MSKNTRRKFIRNSFLLSTGLLLTDSFWAEKFFVRVNEYVIPTSGDKLHGLLLVQISDLHLTSINYPHQYIIKKINEINPHLVFITGDSIDKNENLPLLEEFLSGIKLNIKKVAILGNWEYWGKVNLDKLTSLYNKYNGELLINTSRKYMFSNKAISVTGIDDYIGGQANYELARQSLVANDFHIVLNHCPEYRDQIQLLQKDERIDLVVSGHTHGGQINLFGFAPFVPPGSGNYLSGWYKATTPHLYVSKGVGTSILPIRFGARAEITIFYI